MIGKIVWCLFILFFLNGSHCSPTERDLYVFTTVANAAEPTTDRKDIEDKVPDTESAETNTYSNPYGDTTEFRSEDIAQEDTDDDPPGPANHVIPYSEHENPDEVPTRPKYVAPGNWAKPDPKKNIPLDFVPTKTLAQVRGTHSVKVLPQSEAIAAATSDEERENAPRLREVVSKKKTNTIYTEEGYEDSAYDHAGHIRDADFHEGYAKKLHDERHSKARSGAGRKKKSRKRKSKNKASRPRSKDFEEFTDDYSDEHAPREKYKAEESSKREEQNRVNKIYKNMWKKPDINPKIVTENEIEKLEFDLKKEATEAEKGSENYASITERDLHQDSDREDTNDFRHLSKTKGDIERNIQHPSFGKRENFYKENYEATTIQFETPSPGEPETYEASTSNYENPTINKYYFPAGSALQENYEATTFTYDHPNNPQPVINDASTTMNYGEIFWKHFQAKPNEATSPRSYLQEQTTIQQPLLVQETTTLDPFAGQNPPIALATINGHGPYLLVSENGEVTQNPNQFRVGDLSYFTTNQNGHQYIDPNSILDQQYSFKSDPGSNSHSGQSFPSFIDSNGPAASAHDAWELNSGGYRSQDISVISTESPTSTFYDNIAFASTPTYSLITLPPNEYESSKTTSQKDSSLHKNRYLDSVKGIARNHDGHNHENLASLYEGWPENNQNFAARVSEQSTTEAGSNKDTNPHRSKFNGNKKMSFFGYKPNLDYTKMLSFIKNNQNSRYNKIQSESPDTEDFTIMKPPPLRESVFSDFTLNSYPNVAGHSSVKQESEAAQETNGKKLDASKNSTKYNGLSQKDIHFKLPTYYGDISSAVASRKRIFPASKLLPPAPNSKDNYANQNFANRKNGHYAPLKHTSLQYDSNYGNGVQNYSPDPEQLARYLKNRRTPSRYIRSVDEAVISEEKIADAVIAQEINARFNFTFGDQGPTNYRDFEVSRKANSRPKRNLPSAESQSVTEELLPPAREVSSNEKQNEMDTNRSMRNKRSHKDLLDESHKIAGDVIDGEINSRFKSKNHDEVNEDYNEEEEKEDEDDAVKGEKQVEVEVPDLDYLDEIQEINDIESIPTTTVASIDFQKYPFYMNSKVSNSPLKYIIDPKEVPKKTFGGMEFYDSRDKYVQCDEVDPNLEEIVPDDEEPVPNRGPKQNLPRLRGLGDKLDCFKDKYFGKNPFDNPLFFERTINQPTPPSELDPMKFAARILELPEEDKNYFVPAQSRKPEIGAIKRIDNSQRHTKSQNLAETSNVKSSAEPTTRRRNNANRGKFAVSSTEKPQRETRRSRKRRPIHKSQTTTTELPEVNSVTPYQKEVYDDVMGTIKNLASLYEMFGSQASSPITEATMISPNAGRILGASSIRNVKTINRIPALNGKIEKGFHSSGVTESPFYEEIEGLLPPPELHKKPKILPYRTTKVSYNTRPRTESLVRNGDKKIIGYFRTVMVHKRSLDNNADTLSDQETETHKHTVNKRTVMDSEIEETRANLRTVDPNPSSSTTEGPKRKRRRKTDLSTTTTTTTVAPVTSNSRTETNDKSEASKPRYTIRSRSRNSKDDRSTSRYELFTTTQRTSTAVDGRRNEPRYSEIIRKRGGITTTTTTTPSPQPLSESNGTLLEGNSETNRALIEQVTESGEIFVTENSAPHRRKVSSEHTEPSSEIYTAIASDFEPEHIEEDDEDSENYEEEEREEEDENEKDEDSADKSIKKIRRYDVHEEVQEDTTPSVMGFSVPTKTLEHVDLETYLLTDPPEFSKAFADKPGPTVPYLNADKSVDETENYRNEESKEKQIEEGDEEHHAIPQNASHQADESSDEDGTESPKISESYRDSSSDNLEESEEERKNSEQEDSDDKTFFRYNSRPDSPFESFEDDKYSELGSRVNKPAFHHPPFNAPKYERHYFDNSDEEEKDKTDESSEKEKYAFPWVHDKEDEKAEAQEEHIEQTTEKYEYPWEKRERLAEKRAKRRKDRERLKKLRDFSFLHDDDDYDEDEDEKKASSSETNGKRAYPWDIYDVPSKPYKKNVDMSDEFDSDETSSEHRPVAKFSSKYSSSQFKLPFADSQPITTAQPKKIKESVLKFIDEADEKSSESRVGYETDTFTTSKPERQNETPRSAVDEKWKKEPVSSGSKNNKRISNSRIIPENITTAPRNRSRSRVTPVRDRSTLRPFIRSTTELAVVAKAQTIATPTMTTRRPLRLRGRVNSTRQQPLYKAQESQISSSTVLPMAKLIAVSTTEKLVESSTKNPARFVVRKRGKSKAISTTLETNIKKSRGSQEDVTERSTQATTKSRSRTRPTVATRVATIKMNYKNYEKPNRPSRVDNKNSIKETTYDEYRIPGTSSVDSGDPNVEDSTPTSRTVEHRSRVSKEEIITKTSFPHLDNMYELYKDKNTMKKIIPFNDNSDDGSMTGRKSKKNYSKTPDRGRNSFDKTDSENAKSVENESVEKLSITTKETPEHVYEKKEELNNDGTIRPSALEEELNLEKAKTEEQKNRKDQSYDSFDNAETHNPKLDDDIEISASPEDSLLLGHVLRKIPSRSNQLKETKDSSEEYGSSEEDSSAEYKDRYNGNEGSDESKEDDESEKKSWMVNYEKDPSRRLYYYPNYKK